MRLKIKDSVGQLQLQYCELRIVKYDSRDYLYQSCPVSPPNQELANYEPLGGQMQPIA